MEGCVSAVMKELQSKVSLGGEGGGVEAGLLFPVSFVRGTLTAVGRTGGGATGIGLAELVFWITPFISRPLVPPTGEIPARFNTTRVPIKIRIPANASMDAYLCFRRLSILTAYRLWCA